MDKSKLYIIVIIFLLILIIVLGLFFYVKVKNLEKKAYVSPTPIEIEREKPIEVELVLFFATEDGEHLQKEVRKIKVLPKDLPKRVFEELKKGPKTKNLYKVLGDNIQLRDIYISGNVGFIDLTDDIFKKGMGTTEELLVIYSIVDSLCFSLNLGKIKFLVDGEEVNSFGHIDISGFVYPNYDIISE